MVILIKVFYKREDNPRWRRPGKVLGRLGSIRCASCRVIKVAASNENLNKVDESQPEVDENPSEKQNETINEQTKNHEKNSTQEDKTTRPKRQIKTP